MTREVFRGIASGARQARVQRQDDRARGRARRRFRPVAEVAAHRQRRRSRGAPAARDLHGSGARQTRRHHRQTRRTDVVLPAVARHRTAPLRRHCCSGRSSKTPCRRSSPLPLRREVETAGVARNCSRSRRSRPVGRTTRERGAGTCRARGLRRGPRVARLPDPGARGARQTAGVPRQRSLVAAPAARDRRGRRVREAATTPTCIAAFTS